MFTSLGFDFELVAEQADGDLRVLDDGQDHVSNLEYSQEDAAGHIQCIVGGRYLMEIQLEQLPMDSFQVLEDRDGLFSVLLQMVRGE
ncbi:hypothetical protein [uncultured Muriicola sp.]|uniref:hypothetical protein n=1 Tax=uncultured Muriicola sp. TaxID=1583102 RepID=UPI002625CD1F|nr:hypothetical protein [uncultured Muriicola sp.]